MAKASNKFTLKVLMDKWKSFTSRKATFNFGDEHPVVLEFEGLCHYDQVYQHGDIYCPQCGEQSVWFDKECEDNQNLFELMTKDKEFLGFITEPYGDLQK